MTGSVLEGLWTGKRHFATALAAFELGGKKVVAIGDGEKLQLVEVGHATDEVRLRAAVERLKVVMSTPPGLDSSAAQIWTSCALQSSQPIKSGTSFRPTTRQSHPVLKGC